MYKYPCTYSHRKGGEVDIWSMGSPETVKCTIMNLLSPFAIENKKPIMVGRTWIVYAKAAFVRERTKCSRFLFGSKWVVYYLRISCSTAFNRFCMYSSRFFLKSSNCVEWTACVASFLSANKFGEIIISGTFLPLFIYLLFIFVAARVGADPARATARPPAPTSTTNRTWTRPLRWAPEASPKSTPGRVGKNPVKKKTSPVGFFGFFFLDFSVFFVFLVFFIYLPRRETF